VELQITPPKCMIEMSTLPNMQLEELEQMYDTYEYETYTLHIDSVTGDGFIHIEFDEPFVLEDNV
jgi:hypothetical protein